MIIVNGWKPLTVIIKSSILDVVVVLVPSHNKISNLAVLIIVASKVIVSNRKYISDNTFFKKKF